MSPRSFCMMWIYFCVHMERVIYGRSNTAAESPESAHKITQTHLKSGRKRVHVKDDGKSSSEKLRRVTGYLFYVRDPPETSLKFIFPRNCLKPENCRFRDFKNIYLLVPTSGWQPTKLPINRTSGHYVLCGRTRCVSGPPGPRLDVLGTGAPRGTS